MSEAGNRMHGTTREQPLVRFALENPLLAALPDVPPVLAEWAKVRVHRDCHVQFHKVLYSVPCKLGCDAPTSAACQRSLHDARSSAARSSSLADA
jgi:hypothetical protein